VIPADLDQLQGAFSRFPARLAPNDRSQPIQNAIVNRSKNKQRSRRNAGLVSVLCRKALRAGVQRAQIPGAGPERFWSQVEELEQVTRSDPSQETFPAGALPGTSITTYAESGDADLAPKPTHPVAAPTTVPIQMNSGPGVCPSVDGTRGLDEDAARFLDLRLEMRRTQPSADRQPGRDHGRGLIQSPCADRAGATCMRRVAGNKRPVKRIVQPKTRTGRVYLPRG